MQILNLSFGSNSKSIGTKSPFEFGHVFDPTGDFGYDQFGRRFQNAVGFLDELVHLLRHQRQTENRHVHAALIQRRFANITRCYSESGF